MAIQLEQELTALRRRILTMGAIVEQRITTVLDALVRRDYALAHEVRHGDREIDDREVEIEESCLRVLALAQPVASDLRLVLAILRVNANLERMGDLAKSIAKRVIAIESVPAFVPPTALMQMARSTLVMVREALNALSDEDVVRSRRIRHADDVVDDLNKEIFAWASREIPEHVDATEGAINTLAMSRAMERICDRATNIAEDVLFLVEGDLVRHRPD